MSKIVLIGANHAGTACANTILDNYKDEELVIFDQNSNISFLGCGMALWIGKQIKGPEKLFYCSKEVFEQKGATVHMETKVDNIDYDKKNCLCKGQRRKRNSRILRQIGISYRISTNFTRHRRNGFGKCSKS